MKEKLAAGAITAAIFVAAALGVTHEGRTFTAIQPVPGDPWTLCHGHTKGVRKGDTATKAMCDEWLIQDLHEANDVVDRCITAPMTINQRAALIDFALNVGPGAPGVKDGLCWLKNGKQPYIRRMANEGRWQEACNGFLDWTKAHGVVYRGLVIRRQHERDLCLSDYFANVTKGTVFANLE